MNWSERFAWLAALRAQPKPRSAETDRADMGTAFGLDASFDATAAAEPPPAHTLPPAAPSSFENRLVRRSRL